MGLGVVLVCQELKDVHIASNVQRAVRADLDIIKAQWNRVTGGAGQIARGGVPVKDMQGAADKGGGVQL